MKILFVPVLLFAMLGCHSVVAPVPGSVNTFDSTSYVSLVTADSVIETTKTDLASGAFPATIAPNVKTALNDLIKYYDIADQAYLAYHASAMQGTPTPAQQAAVTAGLASVQVFITALTSAKAGN